MKKLLVIILAMMAFSVHAQLWGLLVTENRASECVKAPKMLTFDNAAKLIGYKYNVECKQTEHKKIDTIEYAIYACEKNKIIVFLTNTKEHCDIVREVIMEGLK